MANVQPVQTVMLGKWDSFEVVTSGRLTCFQSALMINMNEGFSYWLFLLLGTFKSKQGNVKGIQLSHRFV